MQLETVPRKHVAQADWDTLVLGSPDGWVFSLWGWQELIQAVQPWALEDHGFAVREGKRLLAVVPLHYQPATRRMASSGWGGSGPVIDGRLRDRARDRLMAQTVQHCLERVMDRRAAGFEISLSPVTSTSISSPWGVNPLVFHGLEDRSNLTQVVDLSATEEELWADLAPDARRQIKHARDAGFRVERADWSQSLDRYYELHVETYTRTGVQPHPRDYFAGMAAYTAPTGHSVLWAVSTPGGEFKAFHNAAWFGAGGYYHTGCSTEDARPSGASYLLFWEAMLGAKRSGKRWYDCGAIYPRSSANEKQRGLSTFKTKFGGQPHRQFCAGLEVPSPETLTHAVPPAPTFAGKVLKKLRKFI